MSYKTSQLFFLYRTLPNPDFWAIGGLSSSGWGAVTVLSFWRYTAHLTDNFKRKYELYINEKYENY